MISLKPNPALLAAPGWHPDQVRTELQTRLEEARGCNVEIVLNSVSTGRRRRQNRAFMR